MISFSYYTYRVNFDDNINIITSNDKRMDIDITVRMVNPIEKFWYHN